MNADRPGDLQGPSLAVLRRIDEVCAHFEQAWRSGQSPRIEDFLGSTGGTEREHLFRELLLAEVELRLADGATALESDYGRRFPEYGAVIGSAFAALQEGKADDTPGGERTPLTPGGRLGRYEIVEALGAGGMGEVFRARDVRLGREVAVKVLPDAFSRDPPRRTRFEQEARVVARLAHPNIVVLHDVGTDRGVFFVVMELLEGETLRCRVSRSPLPWQQVVQIGTAIADGLEAAHARGIVHRDIKPENLFLSADGRVKILDFGLARVEVIAALSGQAETTPVPTEPGVMIGTVGYMAPEQVRGRPVDARSDLFALGCVLYELLTGRRAFWRDSAVETQMAILHDEPRDPMGCDREVPHDLAVIVRRCLAKEPGARYQSAEDLARALRAVPGPAAGRLPAPRPRGRLHRALWAGAVLAGLALLAGSAYLLTSALRPPHPAAQPEPAIESLAVLPFLNVGNDPDADFLGDGITIALSSHLARLRRLKVRPYSAVTRYKGRGVEVLDAGHELQVEAVLTGTIQKLGGGLHISVELVDVGGHHVLWSETYIRRYENLLFVQAEIARDVTARLRLHLLGEEESDLVRRPTVNLDAYRSYILGRVEWNRRTPEGLRQALAHFRLAIGRDPKFVLAHVGLADSYITLAERGLMLSQEAYPQAEDAARKALQLEPTLADGHVALGMIWFEYRWNFAGAEQAFRRALALNPNHATGRQWYAEFLSAMGRHDEALAEAREAQQLDPNSAIISTIVGLLLYKAGRCGDAIEQYQLTLRMHGDFPRLRGYLIEAYEQKGMYAEALGQWDVLVAKQPELARALRQAYHSGRAEGYWRKRLELREAIGRHHPLSPIFTAGLHARVGQKEEAFAILEKAIADKDGALAPTLKVSPWFEPLRGDPRFDKLLRQVGFAP